MSEPLEQAALLALTFLVGVLGVFIGRKLRFPSPYIVGALLGVAVFNVVTGMGYMPSQLKVFTQIVTGLFIGSRITRRDVESLRSVVVPTLVASAAMIFFCILMGLGLYFATDLDSTTALLSSAPGGLVDIILIGYDLEADVSVISVLQVLRLVVVVSIFPVLVIQAVKRFNLQGSDTQAVQATPAGGTPPESKGEKYRRMAVTVVVAAVSGIIGWLLGIPAGALMFSMIGTTVFNIITGKVYMPYRVKQFAQILAGTLIGTSVTMEAVLGLRGLVLPAIILVVGYFVINLGIALVLHRRYGFDMITAFLCITPGGASDISLLAGDLGADTARVSIVQVVRSTCVILFYPILVQVLTNVLP